MNRTDPSFNLATRMSLSYINELAKGLAKVDQDTKRDERHSIGECPACFYLKHSFAGSAFTQFQCRLCGTSTFHPNTDTPDFCMDCSQACHMCVRCGADLDLVIRPEEPDT